jgi:hypothetical protein
MNYARSLCLLASCVMLSACGTSEKVEIDRTFRMVDEEEREAGTVTFHAVGGGEIRDADGKKIGEIVAP